MSRETGPSCRQCRAVGKKLFLKGERCYNDEKCGVKRRAFPPGQHGGQRGGRRRRGATEYAIQLREKQRARRTYGVSERQFGKYNDMAVKKKGITGELIFQALERRLDNVVYRLGFAASRKQARQLIRHRHFLVNKRILDIPSYLVKTDEVIEVKEKSKKVQTIRDAANSASQRLRVPAWLESNPLELRGSVLEMPVHEKMELDFEEHLIVEYYSR
ncbi:MAG: 30S ribosomal protein S4 [bacterium]